MISFLKKTKIKKLIFLKDKKENKMKQEEIETEIDLGLLEMDFFLILENLVVKITHGILN